MQRKFIKSEIYISSFNRIFAVVSFSLVSECELKFRIHLPFGYAVKMSFLRNAFEIQWEKGCLIGI